ncbi:MAG: UDP-N-acetylglucosamine--N-acetylmuramyl-(pentapeptide) pyrophosphoryl-undecaprenol N-acetylglucosamine transferase [Actinomycetota bacterium]|nr:UDP-N-acetylglucosamine--N-acetylmuramyl-(pentapeptide) pyrophosphoryl-undecaprenol N-acetylglucosamine transferase [Actinomycetota bacterium]
MTGYLLAGGGTAGHVNPLLAVADRLREEQPDATVLVLGTREGLESRLVPARGYELVPIPKVPFPRRPNAAALRFPGTFAAAVRSVRRTLRERGIDVVVGFGGYAAAPAYVAARREKIPIVVHEQNAKPGFANRLGSWFTRFVGVTFAGTPLRHSKLVGMPLRREVATVDRDAARTLAAGLFGLDPAKRTLLVTGGSTGARRINATVVDSVQPLLATGWQVLHIVGERAEVSDPCIPGYVQLKYCDRMEVAIGAADFAVSRAGATTVSELGAVGVPAVYIPYPVGNGEQRFNAEGAVSAGAALLVDDAAFTPEWVERSLVPLLSDDAAVSRMAAAAGGIGVRDGAARVVELIAEALQDRRTRQN